MVNGWKPSGKYSWAKGDHIIQIKPTNSGSPRGSKTVWLLENKRIGGRSTRLGYAATYDGGIKIASQYMRKW